MRHLFAFVLITVLAIPTVRAQSVSDYASLRNTAGATGQTRQVTTARLSGTFDYRATDPHGLGDDGTLVISASGGGWWVRRFSYGENDPIRMDWWEGLSNNVDVTNWLKQYAGRSIASADPGVAYFRAPSSAAAGVNSIDCSYINFLASGVTREFSFLESDKPVTIRHVGSEDIRRLWHWPGTSLTRLHIGGEGRRITFVGQHEGSPTGEGSSNSSHDHAMIDVRRTGVGGDLVYFSANITDSYARGMKVVGGNGGTWRASSSRLDSVFVSGTFDNSGVELSSINYVYADDILISDPFGVNQGHVQTSPCGDDVSSSLRQERHRSFGCVYCTRIGGQVTVQYGNPNVGFNVIGSMGYSDADRLVMIGKDIGFLGPRSSCPGQRHARSTGTNGIGKIDPVWTTSTGPVGKKSYMTIQLGPNIYGNGFYSANNNSALVWGGGAWSNESSSVNAGSCCGRTDNFDILTVRLDRQDVSYPSQSEISPQLGYVYDVDPTCSDSTKWDYIGGHTLRNRDGYGGRIGLHRHDVADGEGVGGFETISVRSATTTENGCLIPGIATIRDLTVRTRIAVESNAQATIRNVSFLGTGSVIELSGGTVIVPPGTRLQAPIGTTISGSGTLVCEGASRSLPFTFDGNPDDCEGAVGSPASSSQTLSLSSGWNMVSLNINPSNPAIDQLSESIANELVIVKNASGDLYYPEFNLNTIGNWSTDEGYQMNVSTSANLLVTGASEIDPSTPISLNAGWSLVPFYGSSPMPVEDAFSSVSSSLIMVKDNEGRLYYPDLGIRTLAELLPGQGYSINVSSASTLTYSSN